MKVDFIIAGGQKCGTTALHKFMSHHPQVTVSWPKELDFFNYDNIFKLGYPYYHSHFRRNSNFKSQIIDWWIKRRYLEASPTYLTDCNINETANRIIQYNPRIKIMCLVRNPVDRAFSAWNMYRTRFFENGDEWWYEWMEKRTGERPRVIRRTREEYEDFNLFLIKEHKALSKNQKIACDVLQMGEYYKGIKIFKKVFGENFLIVKNEDLNIDTPRELKLISDFLDLKNYNWANFDGVKIFKGEYNKNLDPTAREILSNYYSFPNQKLYELTGIKYEI